MTHRAKQIVRELFAAYSADLSLHAGRVLDAR